MSKLELKFQPRFSEKARNSKFSLMVSIPRNDPEMGKAAEEAGADAIKMHIYTKHPASQHLFGSLQKERKNLEKVLSAVHLPIGIVPGAEKIASLKEMEELKKMGIDFFDVFAHYLPLDYLSLNLGRMVCLDSRYSSSQVKNMAFFGADVFEASIIPHEGYGKSVCFADLVNWKALAEGISVPIMVSTQRKIRPEEIALLQEIGIRGVVIGVVVTGETAKGVYEAARLFRKAVDRLK